MIREGMILFYVLRILFLFFMFVFVLFFISIKWNDVIGNFFVVFVVFLCFFFFGSV